MYKNYEKEKVRSLFLGIGPLILVQERSSYDDQKNEQYNNQRES